MNDAKKIMLGLLIAQSIGFIILAYLGYYQYISVLEANILNKKVQSTNEISFALEQLKNKYSHLATEIISDENITKAFAKGDYNLLYNLSLPIYKEFKKHNPYVNIMHFHTKDNHSFLRVHRPSKREDDLYNLRKMIVNTNKTHSANFGIEIGKYGISYRVVLPVFYEREYVGAFEIGVDIRYLFSILQKGGDVETLLVAKKSDLQKTIGAQNNIDEYTKPFLDGYVYFDAANSINSIDAKAMEDVILNDVSSIKNINNKKYLIFKSETFKDYNNHDIGFFLFSHDMSYYLNKIAIIRWVSIVTTLLMLVIMGYLVYRYVGRYTKNLVSKNEKLDYQANHDTLTGVNSRAFFIEELERLVQSGEQKLFALMFIDLDRFKQINDTFGHDVGDSVLKIVANALSEVAKDSKSVVARLGGDEFAMIVKNIKNKEDIIRLAKDILKMSSEPIDIQGHILYSTCSIGIAIYPDDAKDVKQLLKLADTAMYKSKKEGRHGYNFYSSHMLDYAKKAMLLETKIREALTKGRFEPYFQPRFNTTTGKIIGLEVLARWIDEDGVLHLPREFLDVANESDLLVEIEKIVFEKALKQITLLDEEGLFDAKVSLNLSFAHIRKIDFTSRIYKIIKDSSFDPSRIMVEIRECDIMEDTKENIDKLKVLYALGVGIAIDNFGAGLSSLSFIKSLPITKLVCDISFVQNIDYDDNGIILIKTIIELAKNLKLTLCIKGVESEHQKNVLLDLGCNIVQGFYYSHPLSSKDLREFLKKINH